MNRTASAYLAAIAQQWLQGKRAHSKQSKYFTVEDSPQVEGVKLPSEGCVGGFNVMSVLYQG